MKQKLNKSKYKEKKMRLQYKFSSASYTTGYLLESIYFNIRFSFWFMFMSDGFG